MRRGWRGDGAAILVQGAFLLALDSHYAYHLDGRRPPSADTAHTLAQLRRIIHVRDLDIRATQECP